MVYDVIIVGGGISGLTAAAYTSKKGLKTLLIEKEKQVGGLVNSFEYKGFILDGGIRSIENLGIVFPMLEQLGIKLEFVKSIVSLGIEKDVIEVKQKSDVEAYKDLLISKFPNNKQEIENIIKDIYRIMHYMDILYGIDNPLFKDLKNDKEYLFKTIIPWLFKYIFTVGKIKKINKPVNDYLKTFTNNDQLIDMIAQHFFLETPAFFALSYFSLYLDYNYPLGGTSILPNALKDYILKNNGQILTDTEIKKIDIIDKTLIDNNNKYYTYNKMVWSADVKTLYNNVETNNLSIKLKNKIESKKSYLKDKRGGDSVLTVYATTNLNNDYFKNINTEHFFYTPKTKGLKNTLSIINDIINSKDKSQILTWVKEYLLYTTYEISIPVLRDIKLAPTNKSALIISTLFEYKLVKHIQELKLYDEFKELCEEEIINVLNDSIYPKLKENIIDKFSSTPLTIERYTNNTDGAITGWAFTNSQIPAIDSIPKVAKSVLTILPDVYQSGQWTYSPAGLPISILTGKLAADKIKK